MCHNNNNLINSYIEFVQTNSLVYTYKRLQNVRKWIELKMKKEFVKKSINVRLVR